MHARTRGTHSDDQHTAQDGADDDKEPSAEQDYQAYFLGGLEAGLPEHGNWYGQ